MNPETKDASRERPAMRRVVALAASVLLVSSIAACGSSGTPAPTTEATTGATSAPADTSEAPPAATLSADDLAQFIGNPDPALCGGREYTFGYNTFSDTEEFAVQFWNGLQQVAEDLGCIKFNKLSDNIDAAQAVQNAKIFVEQKVDGVILFNVLEAAGPGIAQVLTPSGIPAVSIVVDMPGQTFVTNDDMADGTSAGTKLGEAYNASGRTGDVYAIIGRFDGQGPTGVARLDGVVAGLTKTVPQVKLLEFDTKADPVTAQAGAAALLGKIPAGATILVSSINDQNSSAILQAVKQAGREADTIVGSLTGVNPGGLQFMCQNQPAWVGSQGFFPETWSKYILPALMARVQGATNVPPKIVVPTGWIPADEITKFYPDFKCDK